LSRCTPIPVIAWQRRIRLRGEAALDWHSGSHSTTAADGLVSGPHSGRSAWKAGTGSSRHVPAGGTASLRAAIICRQENRPRYRSRFHARSGKRRASARGREDVSATR
jgi:hypothetical protein